MTAIELANLVSDMMLARMVYDRTRGAGDLRALKRLEAEVERAVASVRDEASRRPPAQPGLFDAGEGPYREGM